MKDIRVDDDGELRCWNCGSKGLLPKRTARSKVAFGVGALATKKKLKCMVCGEYNATGNAKPYKAPASGINRGRWRTSRPVVGSLQGQRRAPRPTLPLKARQGTSRQIRPLGLHPTKRSKRSRSLKLSRQGGIQTQTTRPGIATGTGPPGLPSTLSTSSRSNLSSRSPATPRAC